ncbi:hypothetical protein TWF481_007071 [Arthrobotrys musiformis]|uniref:Cyclin N-terminal domain-containing protein n=1 Tax=Arthrobotrys musiformis TaxID=47236 RepID=A0AAV9WBR9_9PEZI
MESKVQRKTRIIDENDPAVMAAGSRQRRGASTASMKSTASTRQRTTSQSTKRVALVDSTRHEPSVAGNSRSAHSRTTSKGSLSQPSVRGKPLAAKSNASLATGVKSTQQQQQSGSQQSASTSIKSTIYRDPQQQQQQQTRAKGPVRSGQSHVSIGAESRTQPSRQKAVVFRDEPTVRPAAESVSHFTENRARPGPLSSKTLNRSTVTADSQPRKPALKAKETAVAPQVQQRIVSQEYSLYGPEERRASWDDEEDEIVRHLKVTLNLVDKPCLAKIVREDEDKPVYNPMRQLVNVKKKANGKESKDKWVCFPASGWDSHERDARGEEYDDDKEGQAAQEYVKLVENHLFEGFEEEYLARVRRNGEGDRNRVYPRYTAATDLEVVEAVMIHSQDPDFKPMQTKEPAFAEEYAPDIIRHMWAVDRELQPDPHYMDTQPYLGWHMRGILVDWMIEVHERFQLSSETLFNTVNIIDRFLSVKIVPVHQLQLVGLAALLIAAKYDEITPPGIDMLVYMADHAYTGLEIRNCEYEILAALEWKISAPGPMSFLRCLSPADTWDADVRDLAQYFLEAALTELRFVGTPWSFIVAASYYLSMIILDVGRGEWSPAHIYTSGHCASQLAPGVQVLIEMMDTPEDHHKAVFTKYNRKNHRRIAGFVERWMVAQFAQGEEPAEGKGAAYAEGRGREEEIRERHQTPSSCVSDPTGEEEEEVKGGLLGEEEEEEEKNDEEEEEDDEEEEEEQEEEERLVGQLELPAEDKGAEQCFYCSWKYPLGL